MGRPFEYPAARVKGPLPTGLAAKEARAATAWPGTGDSRGLAATAGRSANGSLSSTSRVVGSGAESPARCSARPEANVWYPSTASSSAAGEAGRGRVPGLARRSQASLKSPARTGAPSEYLASGRSWKRQCRSEGSLDQEAATAGRTAPLGSMAVRPSNRLATTSCSSGREALAGSRERGARRAIARVPPRRGSAPAAEPLAPLRDPLELPARPLDPPVQPTSTSAPVKTRARRRTRLQRQPACPT